MHNLTELQLLAGAGRLVHMATLARAFGGSPDQRLVAYRQYSVFSNRDSTGGNLAQLKATPVRVYYEPYLSFCRQQYCPSLLNATMLQQMIAYLRRQGNSRANHIETSEKGRLPKRPFSLSWSIVDVPDYIQWLQATVQE